MEVRLTEHNSQYSSAKAILSVALPACVLNAAAPVTALVQAGLLGTYVGTNALGAFGAVSITAGFATRVFNFLVDGVSAKTGKSVGMRAWAELGARVRMSLGFAVCAGFLASATLTMIMRPVSVDVLRLSDEVQREAEGYWWLRVALVPVLLVNMSLSGILQGFRHVRVAAYINTGQALLEMAGSTLVLRHNWHVGPFDGLFAMGLITFVTQIVALILGFASIMLMPPPEAHGRYSLWKDWFGSRDIYGDLLHESLIDAQQDHSRDVLYEPHFKEIRKADLLATPIEASSQRPLQESSFGSLASTVFQNGIDSGSEVGTLVVRREGGDASAISSSTARQNGVDEPLVNGISHVNGDHAWCEPAFESEQTELRRAETDEVDPHESLLDFVKDGMNMFMRSMILQTTFFASLVAASRLGTPSLAAHSIVNQLWSLISYAVDGFAAAGIVLGSRLAAQAHDVTRARDAKKHLELLIWRVLASGLVAGICAAAVFCLCRDTIMGLFTSDSETVRELQRGTWAVLVASQPVNGLVFVYDGLMYASQSFRFIRNYIILGFLLVFCPLLTAQIVIFKALWAVWLANAAINLWRVGGAAFLIHRIFMREFDTAFTAATSAANLNLLIDEEEP